MSKKIPKTLGIQWGFLERYHEIDCPYDWNHMNENEKEEHIWNQIRYLENKYKEKPQIYCYSMEWEEHYE